MNKSYFTTLLLVEQIDYLPKLLVMDQGIRVLAYPGLLAQHFDHDPGRLHPCSALWIDFLKKDLQNWSFYGIVCRRQSRLSLYFFIWAQAQARSRLDFLGQDYPSLSKIICTRFLQHHV